MSDESNVPQKWMLSSRPAGMEEILNENVVRCHLSPRKCTIKEGKLGFCGVRGNQGGRLVTFNYGKSVHATEETIETEAVNHYSPGERILSMGNIGCMMSCSYCHNWSTSQAKHVSDKNVHYYSPEDVISIAKRHKIRCISWTYNDPVVWHEFVLDTAKLAQQEGLINLYKSAFYISPEAVEELLPYIDIFSISIKSMDPHYYKKMTAGQLEPVLEATKLVHKAGKHLEISTLMVTDISDDELTATKVSEWALKELDPNIPLHYVRFHPDYRMRNTIRTPIPRLIRAREIALAMGMQHVYLGNVYDTPFSNTFCNNCGQILVTRYGLNARIVGLDEYGRCNSCAQDANFKLIPKLGDSVATVTQILDEGMEYKQFNWHGDIRSIHMEVKNLDTHPVTLYHRRLTNFVKEKSWETIALSVDESYRFILAKASEKELGIEMCIPRSIQSNISEVFDRAHYPTVTVEKGSAHSDITPLPLYRAN